MTLCGGSYRRGDDAFPSTCAVNAQALFIICLSPEREKIINKKRNGVGFVDPLPRSCRYATVKRLPEKYRFIVYAENAARFTVRKN